jgi:hypothetical protein
MEELKSVMEEHFDLMSDLVQKISSELRSNLRPAYDNFLGFFHAIDWKVLLSLQFCHSCFFYCFIDYYCIELNAVFSEIAVMLCEFLRLFVIPFIG